MSARPVTEAPQAAASHAPADANSNAHNLPPATAKAAAQVQVIQSPISKELKELVDRAKQKAVLDIQKAEKRLHDVRAAIPKAFETELKRRHQQASDDLQNKKANEAAAEQAYSQEKQKMSDKTREDLECEAKNCYYVVEQLEKQNIDQKHPDYRAASENKKKADEALSCLKPLYDAAKSAKQATEERWYAQKVWDESQKILEYVLPHMINGSDKDKLKKLKTFLPQDPLIAEEKEAKEAISRAKAAHQALSYLIAE